MNYLKAVFVAAAVFSATLSGGHAVAASSYPAGLSEQFTSWCAGTQNQEPSVCSCALNKAPLEIPASALTSFLNAAPGSAMASVGQGVGAAAVQIIGTCALGSGSTGGNVLNSLGGALGR